MFILQFMNKRFKKIVAFSLPVCANNLINILGNMVGVIFIAQLGVREIAAAGLASSLYIALLTITTTTTYATSILVGHALAKEQNSRSIARIYRSAKGALLLLCLPVALILWHGHSVLQLAGQPQNLTELTKPYFHFAALSLIPISFSMVNGQLCIGLGKPNISFLFSMIRLVLTVIVSYGLILGKLGMPKLGISGITASAFMVQTTVCALTYSFFSLAPSFKSLQLFKNLLAIRIKPIIEFYKVGLPIGIQFGGELAAMFVNTMMLGYLGINALAASQVVSQYGLLLIMIVLGVSQTLSVFTSMNHARDDYRQIKQDTYLSVVLHSLIFLSVGTIFLVFYKHLFAVYFDVYALKNQGLFHLTCILLAMHWLTLYVDGLRNLFSGVLRGLKLSQYPMQVGLYCLWLISIPCAYFCGFVLHIGPVGLAFGFFLGFAAATLLLWLKINALGVDEVRTAHFS